MPEIESSRYYPATPEETFAALLAVVRALGKFQSADDFSMAVSFATRMTAWASGANVSAYVRPERDGSLVEVVGQAKMRSQINASNAAHKQIVAILDATGQQIRASRQGER